MILSGVDVGNGVAVSVHVAVLVADGNGVKVSVGGIGVDVSVGVSVLVADGNGVAV
jgi:hypothetical protein